LADKTNPKRLAAQARGSAIEKAQTPVGMAVLGGVGLIVVLLVVRRVRKGRAAD
jgi:hypothetical protein